MAFVPFTEAEQPTMAAFNEKFLSAIDDAVEKSKSVDVKMVFGEYTGTGSYGERNKNTLSADFNIRLVIVHGNSPNSNWLLVVPYGTDGASSAPGYGALVDVSWGGKSVSWYNARSPADQLNILNAKYPYILIGGDT